MRQTCGPIAAILKKEIPPVLTVEDLETTRDMIDVRDAARALILLAERASDRNVYNVSSGKEVNIRDILNTVLSLTRLPTSLVTPVSLKDQSVVR